MDPPRHAAAGGADGAAVRLHHLRDHSGHGVLRLERQRRDPHLRVHAGSAISRTISNSRTYERFVANELATHAFREVDASAGALSGRAIVRNPLGHGDGRAAGVLQPVARPILGPAVRSVGAVGRVCRPTYVNQSYPIFTHLLGVRITERAYGQGGL